MRLPKYTQHAIYTFINAQQTHVSLIQELICYRSQLELVVINI